MKIEHMRMVIEVSQYKSINKASKALFVNQQQLSRIIQTAEEALGVTIFERTAKGVFLTPAGKDVVQKLREIVAIYDGIAQEKKAEEKRLSGIIHLYSDVNIWTGYAGLYTSFMEKYPGIRLFTENMPSYKIIDFLQTHEGIGQISRLLRGQEAEFMIPENLEYHVVAKGHAAVYGFHANPLLCKYKSLSLHTLRALPLVNYKPFSGEEKTLLERAFAPVGLPNIRYEVHNYRVFSEIVRKTECLFLTMRKPNYIDAPDIMGVPLRDPLYFESGLVWNKAFDNALYDAFKNYYTTYYEKLYEK